MMKTCLLVCVGVTVLFSTSVYGRLCYISDFSVHGDVKCDHESESESEEKHSHGYLCFDQELVDGKYRMEVFQEIPSDAKVHFEYTSKDAPDKPLEEDKTLDEVFEMTDVSPAWDLKSFIRKATGQDDDEHSLEPGDYKFFINAFEFIGVDVYPDEKYNYSNWESKWSVHVDDTLVLSAWFSGGWY